MNRKLLLGFVVFATLALLLVLIYIDMTTRKSDSSSNAPWNMENRVTDDVMDVPMEDVVDGNDENSQLRIQIASDLHIEFYDSFAQIPLHEIIVPKAPVLALLGDIGLAFTDILRSFLHYQADQFEQVIVLTGNHEFYNHNDNKQHTVQEQMAWMKKVCDEKPNLHLMERSTLDIDGVRILGTILWSHIPSEIASHAERSMNDYHLSYVGLPLNPQEPFPSGRNITTTPPFKEVRQMTANFTNAWHQTSVEWLEDEIERAAQTDTPVVVLTHHTPAMHGTSDPVYDGSELSHCFSTPLTHLLHRDPVVAWACGHTHYNFDMVPPCNSNSNNNGRDAARLFSNQRGYPGKERVDYDPEGVVLRVTANRG